MKLKDLSSILYSTVGEFVGVIVYDYNNFEYLCKGASIEYAMKHYGEATVHRILAEEDKIVIGIRR